MHCPRRGRNATLAADAVSAAETGGHGPSAPHPLLPEPSPISAMRIASTGLIRSATRSRTSRRDADPNEGAAEVGVPGPRVVAQYRASETVNSISRSPDRVSLSTKASTARRACSTLRSPMWRSSNTIAKVRRVGGPATFVATRAVDGLVAAPVSGAVSAGTRPRTASKAVTACGRPSSRTTKSSRVSPATGLPSRSSATTSTVTSSAAVGNRGGGSCARAGVAVRARQRATPIERRLGNDLPLFTRPPLRARPWEL